MVPFLKWPGGKRWFVARHPDYFPCNYGRYIEPFLGGGAVFFFLRPKSAILGDINPELIATYEAVRDASREVAQLLTEYQSVHSKRHYYSLRGQEPKSREAVAARMIYLNRTCFNGIYRVNLAGEFNVPKGTKKAVLLETDDFPGAAKLLKKAELRHADFESIIDEAKEGDFVFADPPYTVRHNVNGFVKYNETLFSWDDQVRLADALHRAGGRGVKILSTNANHDSVRSLYRDRNFVLTTTSRYSSISAASESRKQFEELVIRSSEFKTA